MTDLQSLRPTLRRQIGWAEGMAAQHARIAARNPEGSPARIEALRRRAIALAAADTLRTAARRRSPTNPEN